KHGPGAPADVEHRIHALEQLDGLEPRGMVPAFVADAEEIADLRRREAAPGLPEPRGSHPWSTVRQSAMNSTRQAGPPMRPANRTYAAADTPRATSSEVRSWIQTATSAARTPALPGLAPTAARTADRMRPGASRRTLVAVYDTPAHARAALATANPTKPSHGTSATVITHKRTALTTLSRKTRSARPRL